MARRALIVGVNHYRLPGNDLAAAVADATAIAQLLAANEDGTPNYDCRVLLDQMEDGRSITRGALREAVRELFASFKDEILFYFSGHGIVTDAGGYLCTTDAEENDWGIPMDEIMTLAAKANARDVLLILDCCHSGVIANPAILQEHSRGDPLALLGENVTILASSHAYQQSQEAGGHGLFTAAVLDALDGGAADHIGHVTAPQIYGYVERRFDAWGQRPVYKSHTTGLVVVRKCAPLIDRLKLRQLIVHFHTEDYKYPLNPEHEPEDEHGNVHEPVNHQKVQVAQLFKEYRDAGLLKPSTPGEQLYWTARRSRTVELTLRGREYWRLVAKKRI